MNEERFEKHILELQEEYSWGRHHEYYREVIDKLNPLQKLSFNWHMKNYDRKPRDIQQISVM